MRLRATLFFCPVAFTIQRLTLCLSDMTEFTLSTALPGLVIIRKWELELEKWRLRFSYIQQNHQIEEEI